MARDTCRRRSEIAHPCCGWSESAFKIRRSSVPCGRSRRSMWSLSLLQANVAPVEVQGDGEARAIPPLVRHSFLLSCFPTRRPCGLLVISAYAGEKDVTGARRMTNTEGRTTGRKARNEQRL